MSSTLPERIVLFDGVCNLCSRSVQFIIRNDSSALFKFCSLQSEVATELLSGRISADADLDTVVLLENDVLYTRSTAALRIAGKLRFPWKLLALLLVVPRPIRDLAYRLIAANRYRLFGKRNVCLLPTDDTKERFLEGVQPTQATDQPQNPVQ